MRTTRYDRLALKDTFTIAGNVYPFPLQIVLASSCAAAVIYFVVVTFRWPMVWDETVMHYVNFLMAHGMAPYRDIYDMNLPGIYLIDGWQMHLFGPGDLACRLYEFFLLGSLLVSMIVIAWPRDWLAGLIAGAVFILFHAGDGPREAVQRDEIVTVLLMAGYALLFQAVRRKQAAYLLPFGICVAFAMGIKPTVFPLVAALMLLAGWALKQRGEALITYLAYATLGLLIPSGIILHFLLHYHAIPAFLDLSRRLTPYYAGLMNQSLPQLIRYSLTFQIKVMVILAAAIALVDRESSGNWERWAVLLGVAGGLFSYVIQRKGFPYHRYPLLAFTLLWVCIEFTRVARKKEWVRWAGMAGLIYAVMYLIPLSRPIRRIGSEETAFTRTLQADLTALGGDKLQHRVQCLDMVDGCLGALYNLGLVQSTGFTGDTLFFIPSHAPAVDYYRSIFLNDIYQAPPKIFVLSNEWFNWKKNFNKVDNWPVFAAFLRENYTLIQSRNFDQSAYRVYLLKSNPPAQ